jgi:small subunit ribosomal protein S18
MPSSKLKPRREKKGKAGGFGQDRRRYCSFCKEEIEEVDFRSAATLRRFMSDKGKIRSRRITGTCRRHQNQVASAIKRAREMALLPYVNR